MRRYRTEIIIPADRTVILHLPASLPEGRAVVIFEVDEPTTSAGQEHDVDHLDVEWWEEFEDEPPLSEGESGPIEP